jgi:hypothetical protein
MNRYNYVIYPTLHLFSHYLDVRYKYIKNLINRISAVLDFIRYLHKICENHNQVFKT